jgi:glycosyltransferase involved in cell wall biosynthesis
MENYPIISVIVPAFNAEKTIRKCVESLLAQDYPNKEIMFVNDGSTDATGAILQEYKSIKVFQTSGLGPSAARNLALDQVQGDLVAFTDADCIADKKWLSQLFREINNDDIAGVGGTQKSPPDDSRLGKEIHHLLSEIGFISDYMHQKNCVMSTRHNPSCNVLYKRDVLTRMGGFKTDLWPGEDTDLDRRLELAGYKFLFNPDAVVYHYRPNSLRNLMKMMVSYGSAQASLVKIHGFFRKIQFVPIILIPLILLEIYFLMMGIKIFLGINIGFLIFTYLYFLSKTKRPVISGLHIVLFCITISGWLVGFCRNFAGFKSDVQQSRKNLRD